jgi:hypothetical protein
MFICPYPPPVSSVRAVANPKSTVHVTTTPVGFGVTTGPATNVVSWTLFHATD